MPPLSNFQTHGNTKFGKRVGVHQNFVEKIRFELMALSWWRHDYIL